MADTVAPQGRAKSQLWFLDRLDRYKEERPYLCHFRMSAENEDKRTNLQFSSHLVEFQDIRCQSAKPRLSTEGFEWVQPSHEFNLEEVRRNAEGRRTYCVLVEQFMKEHLRASHAFTYQCVVRKVEPPDPVTTGSEHYEQVRNNKPIQSVHLGKCLPVTTERRVLIVHADYSSTTSTQVKQRTIKDALSHGWIDPESAKLLESCRFQLINTWRPLKMVENWPLAFCDFRTVDPELDGAVIDQVHSTWVDESMFFHHSDKYEWSYISNQEPRDVMLFRLFDSHHEPYAVHASGPIFGRGTETDSATRESIETRLVIFHAD